jgi:hypothetical protein
MLSVTEKELYAELEYIMVAHRYKCSKMEIINTPNSLYLYRIKKALLKSVVEEKRIVVLKNLIGVVKNKISNGYMFKEIFEPLPVIASDMLKAYRKGNKPIEPKSEEKDEYQEYLQRRFNYLDGIVTMACEKYEPLTRVELENLEVKFHKSINDTALQYGIISAPKEIYGSFYTGMIENTRKNFEKYMCDEHSIVIKENERLSNQMSDRLLLYDVAGLHYINVMCKKRQEKIKPLLDVYPDKNAYEGLKNDIYLLGKVIRLQYLNETGLTPKEELIENYTGGQITMNEIIKKEKKRKRS